MSSAPNVVVVGSGIVGCAVAYELARRGAKITVLDDREPGLGATQASAGMLAPHLEALDAGPLRALTTQGLHRFDAFVARLSDDSGLRVEYRRTGSLSVALSDADAAALAETITCLRELGVAAELLEARALRREEPSLSPAATGGLLIAPHGYVAPAALTRACVEAAQRFGARVERAGRVTRIERHGAVASAETPDERFEADYIVLAAGSWSGCVDVQGAARRVPVHPVRGQLVELRCDRAVLRRVTWSDRCYLVPRDEGSVLVGATVEHVGFDERTTAGGVSDLLAAARAVAPALADAAFAGARAGLRPGSEDGLPIVGASVAVPQLIYATGHFRNGVLLAPLTAELVATLLLDGFADPLLAMTSPARFGVL